MVPRFQADNVTLYQGDALAILTTLKSGSVDAVLTDPPYSSGGVSLSTRQADPAQKYQLSGVKRRYPPMLGDAKDQHSWAMWCTLWLGECWRIARDGAPLMVFTDWRQLPALSDAVQAAGWKWLGIVPWDKRSARPQMGRFRQQCEYVLIENLLAVAAAQATVLDPFMGGGSVGEACIRTGRGYIGMELSPEYYEISRSRLTAVLAERT